MFTSQKSPTDPRTLLAALAAGILLTSALSVTSIATRAQEAETDSEIPLDTTLVDDETDVSLPDEAFDNGLENPEIAESGPNTTTKFNRYNRFLRLRNDNSRVFRVVSDTPRPGQTVTLKNNNPDTLGMKWEYLAQSYQIIGLNDYCLGLGDSTLGATLQLADCEQMTVKWNFDEIGRLVGLLEDGTLGCVEATSTSETVTLVLTTCNSTQTQRFELEGTNVTKTFAELEMLSQEMTGEPDDTDEDMDGDEDASLESTLSYLESRPEFSSFVTLLEESGLRADIEALENATILVPNNQTVENLGDDTLAILRLPENREILRTILAHHVVPEKLTATELLSDPEWRTLSGFEFFVNIETGELNGFANLTQTDIEVENDVILHVLDGVLVPNIEIPQAEDAGNGTEANGPVFDEEFSGASAVDLSPQTQQLFVSSNTQGMVGVYDLSAQTPSLVSFPVQATDADGLYYDEDADTLFQVNRGDNRIDSYLEVNARLAAGQNPLVGPSSSADFADGRELAVYEDLLIVAQDASDANGNENKLFVYKRREGAITLEKVFRVDINLWGIRAVDNDLFAIVDNSNRLAIFEDFFGRGGGDLQPNRIITVEGIVRTHGLDYDQATDTLVLTDVGEGSVDDDGALTVIYDYTEKARDNSISLDEQMRIEGVETNLGNPVDIAYQSATSRLLVAERANAGGRVLTFDSGR